MTESPTLTQTAPSQTGPSIERSQGLDLGKSIIVPYMHIKETLQKNQYGLDTGRDVTYAELSAAAHRQGYGLNETDARVHGLLDGSRPTTLANYQKLSSEATLRSLGREFKGYAASVGDAILHPQDTSDKALKGLDKLRNDVRTAGMQRAQEGYDMQVDGAPSAVGATLGVVVETSTRVVNAGAAGVLGLAQLAVHPVESVKSAADAALSPIETGKKLHNWYEKSSAADVGEGMLTVLTGAKAAPAMNAAAVSTAKAVAAIPVVAKTGAAIGEAAAPAIAAVKANPTVVATVTAVQPAVQAVTTGAKAVNNTVIQPVRNAYNKVEQKANDAYAAVVDKATSAVVEGAEGIRNSLRKPSSSIEGETTGPTKGTAQDPSALHEFQTPEVKLSKAQLDFDSAQEKLNEFDIGYEKQLSHLNDVDFVRHMNGEVVRPELHALDAQRLALTEQVEALQRTLNTLELQFDLVPKFEATHNAANGATATNLTPTQTQLANSAPDADASSAIGDPVYRNTWRTEEAAIASNKLATTLTDIPTQPESFAFHKAPDYYIKGELIDGKLGFNIDATNQTLRTEHGSGQVLFDRMMTHFGPENIREIENLWPDAGTLASNGQSFIKSLSEDGMTPLSAAANTWTGKVAQRHGFEVAEVRASLSKLDGESLIHTTFRRPHAEEVKTAKGENSDPRAMALPVPQERQTPAPPREVVNIPDSFWDELLPKTAPELAKSTPLDTWFNEHFKPNHMDPARQGIDVNHMDLISGQGIEIPRRATRQELIELSRSNDGAEFAVSYQLGDGKNGGAGQYYLHKGENASVSVLSDPNRMVVAHVHPDGVNMASDSDMASLAAKGGLQKSSEIIPIGEDPIRFNATEKRINPPTPDPLPRGTPFSPVENPFSADRLADYKDLRSQGRSAIDAGKLSSHYEAGRDAVKSLNDEPNP